jgi:hypothetical protein
MRVERCVTFQLMNCADTRDIALCCLLTAESKSELAVPADASASDLDL